MKTDALPNRKDGKSKQRELNSIHKPKKCMFEKNIKILMNNESPKKKKAKTNSLDANIKIRKSCASSKVNKEIIKELNQDFNFDVGNKGNDNDKRTVNSKQKDFSSKLRILNDEDKFNLSNIDDYCKNDDDENNEISFSKPDPKQVDDIIFNDQIVNDINNFNLSPIEISFNSYFNKNIEVKKSNSVLEENIIVEDISNSRNFNKKDKRKSFFCCF